MDFEINDHIVFQNNNANTHGVITTIFTNRSPTQYIVQTQQQKFLLNRQQIQKNNTLSIDFQRILSQLIMQKNEDTLIEQLHQLLSKITPQQVTEEQNGAKILYTTYQFLIMRKPSIVRNYPFAATNKVIKMLKKMIFAIRKEVLIQHNLTQPTNFKQVKQHKLNRKFQIFCDDSEKDEQPTAFYENLSCSAFRPYKSDTINQKLQQQVETKPVQEQIRNIYFKPIILQAPTYQILC